MNENKTFILSKTQFHVTSPNVKPEKMGKKKQRLRVDLDGYVVVHASVLDDISRVDTDSLQVYLFKQDGEDKGNPQDTGMDRVPYKVQFNDHPFSLSVTEKGKETEHVSKKIHKFAVEPSHANHVKIHMQIQVYPVNAKDLWALAQTCLEPHYIEIMAPPTQLHVEDEQPQQDLEEREEEEEPEEEEENA
jgi:hypothetical protein